jgi:dephospho-CoA kinase
MIVVGLTGGIASGKTEVAKILRDLGAFIIDADEVSRAVVVPHSACWDKLVASFGRDILCENSTIDRKKLSQRIFNNPEQRIKLNRLIHPEINKHIEEELELIKIRNTHALVVIDAALLVETGLYKKYDKLIVVHTREETQLKRLMNRDSISREEALSRINSQLPLQEKLNVADIVIDNEDNLKKTREAVEEVFIILSSMTSLRDSGSGET